MARVFSFPRHLSISGWRRWRMLLWRPMRGRSKKWFRMGNKQGAKANPR
ncbi:hypothetical protein OROMI_004277 [Orobanche minor]